MSNDVYTRAFTGNQAVILAKQMQFEQTFRSFWGKMSKFTTPNGIPVRPGEEPNPVESPIVVQHELASRMGDTMKIPLVRALTGRPRYGREELSGNEEEIKFNHAIVPVDIFRHAAKTQEGRMMYQRTKEYQIAKRAKTLLSGHYGMSLELLMHSYAVYYGFSQNIIHPNNTDYSGNTDVKKISCPNVFMIGQGAIAVSSTNYPSTAGWETDLGAALDNVGETDTLSVGALRALKAQQIIQRLRPLGLKNGNQYWIMVAHPYMIADLEADDNFNRTASAAYVANMVKDNPLLVGCKYECEGFLIYPSDTACWPVRKNATSGKIEYGPEDVDTFTNMQTSFRNYVADEKFAAIILGSNALFRGIVDSLVFIDETKDYRFVQGLGYETMEAVSRGDFWNFDDGTKGQYIVNDGVALLIGHATQPSM